MKYRISTYNERVSCTTQLAKLSFNLSIGRTHRWRFIFYEIVCQLRTRFFFGAMLFFTTVETGTMIDGGVVRAIEKSVMLSI